MMKQETRKKNGMPRPHLAVRRGRNICGERVRQPVHSVCGGAGFVPREVLC